MKALALAAFIAAPAAAQTVCLDRVDILQTLSEDYREGPRLGALGGDLVIEFFANEETGTWTLIATGPDGTACIVAVGEGFQIIAPGDLM